MSSEPTFADPTAARREERPRRMVLIAEDNDDFRELLTVFLSGRAYEVVGAKDGREAVAAALRYRPALVLMDIGLPGVDGLSAAREIRGALTAAETVILVVSAYDSAEFRAEAIEAGCAMYLVKPIEPAALHATIDLLLRGREGGGAGAVEGRSE